MTRLFQNWRISKDMRNFKVASCRRRCLLAFLKEKTTTPQYSTPCFFACLIVNHFNLQWDNLLNSNLLEMRAASRRHIAHLTTSVLFVSHIVVKFSLSPTWIIDKIGMAIWFNAFLSQTKQTKQFLSLSFSFLSFFVLSWLHEFIWESTLLFIKCAFNCCWCWFEIPLTRVNFWPPQFKDGAYYCYCAYVLRISR